MTKNNELAYKYIFGPVPSRRLGQSLGLDIVPPKTCTLDCVYCECGRTTHLTVERKEYTPRDRIKAEMKAFLAERPRIDHITFSGSGEPTLHSGIADIVRYLKTDFPIYKLALLTNGTLLYKSDVRNDLLEFDLVKVSLDAVYKKNFKRINRPHRELEVARVIEGMAAFRKIFKKQFWVEVFLVPGCNDSEVELKQIRHVLNMLAPDRIQLNTLDRPGTEPWVKPEDPKMLTEIAAFLYNAEIITHFKTEHPIADSDQNFDHRLLSTLQRRPCTADDISRFLGLDVDKVQKRLDTLIKDGAVVQKEMQRGVFYWKQR